MERNSNMTNGPLSEWEIEFSGVSHPVRFHEFTPGHEGFTYFDSEHSISYAQMDERFPGWLAESPMIIIDSLPDLK